MFKIPDFSLAPRLCKQAGLGFCVKRSRSPYTCIGRPTAFLHDCALRCALRRSHLKGALSRYSVSLCRFLRSKKAARRLEAAAPPKESQALAAIFFTCSKLRSTLEYQSVTPAESFLSLGRSWALRYDQENEKTSLSIDNCEKFMKSKTGLQSSTD